MCEEYENIIYSTTPIFLSISYLLGTMVYSKIKQKEELIEEYIKKNKKLIDNDYELKETNQIYYDEIQKLKILNDKLTLELKNNKNLNLEKKKEKEINEKEINEKVGKGILRYKNQDETMYYHGIGHLEKKYSWWRPEKNHCIIEYQNNNRLKYIGWETNNIQDFCNNCILADNLNKGKRKKLYYICQGHSINN